ncbi:MAG: long-chain fatty acid--CoA ligase, partial [Bacteroidales bacterium]|nr:long-chain fatty acid--CoA ligase [Bacteroidales bacterium]
AYAMAELGVEPGDRIGVYSENMAEYLITDFGAYANRCVMVPMYATASPSQVEYIVNDAEVKVIFVGEQFQYNHAFKVQSKSNVLSRLIIFDRNVVFNREDETSMYFDDFLATGENAHAQATVNARMKQLKDTDLATIIYTSGTTGVPKGVMLLHSSYNEAFRIHDERLTKVTSKDVSMCFLPLTHIFEKTWSYYCIHKVVTIAVNKDPRKRQLTIKEVRPTLMSSVPRFWEKVYTGVNEQINSSSKFMQKVFKHAIETGRRHNLDYRNEGIKAPLWLSMKFQFYKVTVFYLLKYVVGINKGNIFPCAGAPLSDNINTFLQSVDIHIIYGYGLTETTATVTCFPFKGFKIGTVGTVMPDVEVKIGDNNEILVKGATVMSGYYNLPEETANVFTADGYFRTGDAGYLTDKGELVLTERIKDLYKTSNGKYIAPQMIETRLGEDKYIDMVAVIGDERKFVSGLIVPNYEALEEYAHEHAIAFSSREELVANEEINDLIYARVELKQVAFTSFEKIKKFVLLPRAFTIEDGELTNTLKLRRKAILEGYSKEIESMYVE